MYQSENNESIPCPFIPYKKDYLDLAKKYLHEFDYPACANYLRKESERVLRELLPHNITISADLENGSKQLLLNAFINKFEHYYKSIDGDFTPFEKLKEYKDLLMNPLSHHNSESPIYKQELINTFEILKKLNEIRILRFETDTENENPFTLCEKDASGDEFEYTFYLREQLLIRKDLDGTIVFNNPKCWFDTRKNITKGTAIEDVKVEFKINEGYDKIRHTLGIKTAGSVPNDLKSIVKLNGDSII